MWCARASASEPAGPNVPVAGSQTSAEARTPSGSRAAGVAAVRATDDEDAAVGQERSGVASSVPRRVSLPGRTCRSPGPRPPPRRGCCRHPLATDDEDATVGQERGGVGRACLGERACRAEGRRRRVPDLRRGEDVAAAVDSHRRRGRGRRAGAWRCDSSGPPRASLSGLNVSAPGPRPPPRRGCSRRYPAPPTTRTRPSARSVAV